MHNNIFDSHAHYDDTSFSEDLSELLEALPKKGISGVVNCATDINSCKKCAEICFADCIFLPRKVYYRKGKQFYE